MDAQRDAMAAEFAKTLGPVLLIGFVLFMMWLAALIDVIRSNFRNPSNKTMWILLLIFLAPLGTVLYPFMARGQKY